MPSEAQKEWVSRVLGVRIGLGAPGGASQRAASSLVDFAKARLAWQAAKSTVASKLHALAEAMEESADPDSSPLLIEAITGLDRILAPFNEGLADTLDDLVNAADTDRAAALRQKADTIVEHYIAYLQTDKLIAYVETNPSGPLGIATTLRPPLDAIRAQLAAR